MEERVSGRSLTPYSCNLQVVGQYAGDGASWQHAWYGDCAYYNQRYSPVEDNASKLAHPGTIALDVSNPAQPKFSTNLTTPAMLGPWESLKANEKRGLLGAVAGWEYGPNPGGTGEGPVFFDVYDVAGDCAHPVLKASVPLNLPAGHEGNFSQDGLTYYGTSLYSWTAIDVEDPAAPSLIYTLPYRGANHGLSTSIDGNRVYAADLFSSNPAEGMSGMTIWDMSGVQRREVPVPIPLGSVTWSDGFAAQTSIPLYYGEKRYVLFVDEQSGGLVRIIDVNDESAPKVIAKLKLEIHMPENAAAQTGVDPGPFGYEAHYCGVDEIENPTVAGCSYFQSGVRIFDIRDPYHPKEIAYFNPGGTGGPSPAGSNRGAANGTAGFPSAQVRFIKERGEVWFTDQDKGFHVVRFTNQVWPFQE